MSMIETQSTILLLPIQVISPKNKSTVSDGPTGALPSSGLHGSQDFSHSPQHERAIIHLVYRSAFPHHSTPSRSMEPKMRCSNLWDRTNRLHQCHTPSLCSLRRYLLLYTHSSFLCGRTIRLTDIFPEPSTPVCSRFLSLGVFCRPSMVTLQ